MKGCVVASNGSVRVELMTSEEELKWVVFAFGKTGSVGKLRASVKPKGSKEAWVDSIAIRPAYRKQGTGLLLLELCKAYVRDELGCEVLKLEADEEMSRTGKLVHFYIKAGFSICEGVTRFKLKYHGDETLRVVPMECPLVPKEHDAKMFTAEFAMDMAMQVQQEERCKLSIVDALKLTNQLQLAFFFMQKAEEDGQPDWVQFLCLLQGLGHLQYLFSWRGGHGNSLQRQSSGLLVQPENDDLAFEASESDDTSKPSFENSQMPTTKHVWSPDEYLFHVMQKNCLRLPKVALDMVRYRSFASDNMGDCEKSTIDFVQDFKRFCQNTASSYAANVAQQSNNESAVSRAELLSHKFGPACLTW
mmetsp:Transcript_23345/g.41289  ORF Transcript_23345/g.41289 Transcript_23345/m.41289 type:complete len:361 (+) Transcript_23345:221-1303(+)